MRAKISAAALAGAALVLGGCASGGGPSSQRNEPIRALLSADTMMLVSFDTDADLSITTAEIDAGLAREFTRADTNGDGSLSPIEFQAWSNAALGGGHMGPYRLDFDRNVDNVITREEFNVEIRARVSDYDEDGSGALARSELVRLVGQARPPAPQRPPPGTLRERN